MIFFCVMGQYIIALLKDPFLTNTIIRFAKPTTLSLGRHYDPREKSNRHECFHIISEVKIAKPVNFKKRSLFK